MKVLTPEEVQYPAFAAPRIPPPQLSEGEQVSALDLDDKREAEQATQSESGRPEPGHVVVPENTKGWSYRRLFAQHLRGAEKVVIRDPYVRLFFQARNLMEFLEIHPIPPNQCNSAILTRSDPWLAPLPASYCPDLAQTQRSGRGPAVPCRRLTLSSRC